MMKEKYNPEEYWDNVASYISQRTDSIDIAGDDEPYYRYKRKRFLKLLDSIDFYGKSVLEVGSGPGGNLQYLMQKKCKKIVGVDISSKMVELSEQLFNNQNIVQIMKINGKELPFENDSFDIVFTSTVLQHVTDENQLESIICQMCRVSKSDVIIFERIENKLKRGETNVGRPITDYTDLFNKNGLSIQRIAFLNIQASYFVCGVIRKVFNRKGRKEGEPLSKLSIILEKISLPITWLFDKMILSKRDLGMLHFKKSNS